MFWKFIIVCPIFASLGYLKLHIVPMKQRLVRWPIDEAATCQTIASAMFHVQTAICEASSTET
jgi:hypothetical protein